MSRSNEGKAVRAAGGFAAGRGMALSQLAAAWCRSESFQDWVESCIGAAAQGESRERHAAQYVRDVCGVASRAELDHNALAADRFHAAIRGPFRRWSGIDG